MKIKSFSECRHFIKSDAYRHIGTYSMHARIKLYFKSVGFRYTFWMRICCYLSGRKLLYLFYVPSLLKLKLMSYFTGLQISHVAEIGKGFYIGHFGPIRVSSESSLGCNVNVSSGVVIGHGNRGKNKGVPHIGNNVYIASGAKLFGNVTIGDNTCIGANAVVTHDVPDNACVAGVPARIISMKGTEGYVNRTV